MRIKALPSRTAEILGAGSRKEAAPYLKKIQQLYCDRLSNNRFCPTKCWRCHARLEEMASRMAGHSEIAYWHVVVLDYTAELLEKLYEQSQPARGGGGLTGAGELAARLREMLHD